MDTPIIHSLDFFPHKDDLFHIALHKKESHGFLHSHDYAELIYIERGCCHQNVNGQLRKLAAGSCCLLDIHSSHQITEESADSLIWRLGFRPLFFHWHFLEMIQIGSSSSFVNHFLDSLALQAPNNYGILFHTERVAIVRDVMSRILEEYYNQRFCIVPVLLSNIYLLFLELMRCGHRQEVELLVQDHAPSGISEIYNYIFENCSTCTLEEAAAHFGYSGTYLSRLLQKQYQKSFQEIRTEARLVKSIRLLLYSDFSVQEIANQSGYQNLSYFYRIFEQQFGCTPQQYRSQQRQNPEIRFSDLLASVMGRKEEL